MTQTLKDQLALLEMKNPEYDGDKIIFKKNNNLSQAQATEIAAARTKETLIEINDWFLKPDLDFHKTVNKGKAPPKHKRLYIKEIKHTEKSTYVEGHYEDEQWDGWIPKKCFIIIE